MGQGWGKYVVGRVSGVGAFFSKDGSEKIVEGANWELVYVAQCGRRLRGQMSRCAYLSIKSCAAAE